MNRRFAVLAALALATNVSATTFTVTNTSDSGAGSLRQALLDAQNCTGAPHTIAFHVPAGSLTGGVAMIAPASPLPAFTCAGTTIDGTTQTTNGGNTNDVTLGFGGTVGTGPDGVTGTGDEAALPQLNGPEVEIDGSALTGAILILQASDVTVRGLSLHGGGDFSGVGTGSGNIDIQSGAGIVIEDNVIGASATSYTKPNGSAQTQNNLIRFIGGSGTVIQNNLFGFTRWRSIVIFGPAADVTIQSNEFSGSFDGIDFSSPGFGPSGTITVSKNYFHDFVTNGQSTVFGIFYTQEGGQTVVEQNTFERVDYGLIVDPRRPLLIEHNVITGGIQGITIGPSPSMPTRMRRNSIFDNAGLGIDLLGDGVTPNDIGDADNGPNRLQNFPLVTNVEHAALEGTGSTRIVGTFHGASSTALDLEFFANGSCLDFPRDFLEGETYVGTHSVVTDLSGNASFDVTFPVATAAGTRISATATDLSGNTSEFSQRIIFAISPFSGPAAGGTPVTVSGTNFVDPTAITFGSTPVNVTFGSDQQLTTASPALPPGTVHNVIAQTPANLGVLEKGWVADFLDVPGSQIFYSFVTKLVSNGITVGVGNGNYGVDQPTLRQQMAVFLLKSKEGLCFTPPPCVTPAFDDVPCSSGFSPWINELVARHITTGCGGNKFCPTNPVTRQQMAVFLLKTLEGNGYLPPDCTTETFSDVPCSSPFADWIYELVARHITAGCGGNQYCPTNSASRGQMATFLTKTFGLQ